MQRACEPAVAQVAGAGQGGSQAGAAQSGPAQPGVHSHAHQPAPPTHWPPFLQGAEAQPSAGRSQCAPAQPTRHAHAHAPAAPPTAPPTGTHEPPCRHEHAPPGPASGTIAV